MIDAPDHCPACGGDLVRHEVDIGVGTQYGPWHCTQCVWQEAVSDHGIAEHCAIAMGNLACTQPGGHDRPHVFEEDFL